jgi:hypothetical protein
MLIGLFYNIMSNCYKFTDNGKIIIDLKIKLEDDTNFLRVKITDTGKGMSEELINNWGEAFNQKENLLGTGLGQFIIKSICLKLNIKFFIPKKNKNSSTGTTFKFLIPINKMNIYSSKNKPLSEVLIKDTILLRASELRHVLSIEDDFKNEVSIETVKNTNCKMFNSFNEDLKEAILDVYEDNNLSRGESKFGINKPLDVDLIITLNDKKKINILSIDDESISLMALKITLKKLAKKMPNYEFNLIFCSDMTRFFIEFFGLLRKGIDIEFFIFDQNISSILKGYDLAKLVNEFYKEHYNEKWYTMNYMFFFFTEEHNITSFEIKRDGINLIKGDHIFGKNQANKLVMKLEEYLNKN